MGRYFNKGSGLYSRPCYRFRALCRQTLPAPPDQPAAQLAKHRPEARPCAPCRPLQMPRGPAGLPYPMDCRTTMPRAHVSNTLFYPGRNVSTFQPPIVSPWFSEWKGLKGLFSQPFSRVQPCRRRHKSADGKTGACDRIFNRRIWRDRSRDWRGCTAEPC